MFNEKDEGLHILTEVGVFGDLDIDNPTAKKVKNKKDEMDDIDALIESAIGENSKNLENI